MEKNSNRIIILGSGRSILDLSKEEIQYINNSDYIIAMNKYMAFYDLSSIRPNSVYFHDIYGHAVFEYLISKCVSDGIKGLTFFLHPYLGAFLYKDKISHCFSIIKDLYYRGLSLVKLILKLNINCDIHRFIISRPFRYIKVPRDYNIHCIRITNWMKAGAWANSFNQKLFHFRGSLTTCINVASILSPGADIFLVGTDFYGSSYFYEEALNATGINWHDNTYTTTKSKGVHFSFIKVKGTSMDEKFPFILRELEKRGCHLYCSNPKSLLVVKAGVPFKKLIND